MRRDVMTWIGRLVGGVFALGVLALVGAVIVMVRQAEGVPPWPIFMGIVGLVILILLAGACLALISIAVSVRRGALALQAMSLGAGPERVAPGSVEEARGTAQGALEEGGKAADVPMPSPTRGPLSPTGLAEAPAPRATRPVRVLVAER